MPVQVQQSSLAAKMGGRLAAVNGQLADKPLDLGFQRLPPGINDGIAKLQMMTWKTQDKDDKKIPKGEVYFSGSAVAVYPIEHNGIKVSGRFTFLQIPLCDVPAKGFSKGSTFEDNFNKFRSLLQSLGIAPCPFTAQTDPTGQQTDAYWKAAMASLCNPQRPQGPVYISFTTEAFTPPKTPQQPNPTTMTMEKWNGPADPAKVAQLNGQVNPSAGVTVHSNGGDAHLSAEPFEEPPTGVVDPRSVPRQAVATQGQPDEDSDMTSEERAVELAYEVEALVEVAMADPQGTTEEGALAARRLEELAWAAGWTQEQTDKVPAPFSNDWAGVGDMALNGPSSTSGQVSAPTADIKIVLPGSKWLFAKRGKDGSKLKNNKGVDLPPQEVVVATVDASANTCTVKTAKDSKDVVDIRTKAPVAVKFDWLEPIA